jgi:hypothetical protein
MKTFFNILQTLVNRKIKTYPDEPFLFFSTSNINEEFYNENIYISFFIYNVYYKEKKILYENYIYRIANAKFLVLNEYLNNIFYSNETAHAEVQVDNSKCLLKINEVIVFSDEPEGTGVGVAEEFNTCCWPCCVASKE